MKCASILVEVVRVIKKLTFEERQQVFSDPEKARSYLESVRWPNGPVCPHCGCTGACKINGASVRKGLWKCKKCRDQFTVTVGTIFQGSHIPLNKWLYAIHLMCESKKSISENQLHRDLEITYKSAWFMTHRIRKAMSNESDMGMFDGVVEADETYVGGKTHGGKRGQGGGKKTPVFSLISRAGNAHPSMLTTSRKPLSRALLLTMLLIRRIS